MLNEQEFNQTVTEVCEKYEEYVAKREKLYQQPRRDKGAYKTLTERFLFATLETIDRFVSHEYVMVFHKLKLDTFWDFEDWNGDELSVICKYGLYCDPSDEGRKYDDDSDDVLVLTFRIDEHALSRERVMELIQAILCEMGKYLASAVRSWVMVTARYVVRFSGLMDECKKGMSKETAEKLRELDSLDEVLSDCFPVWHVPLPRNEYTPL
ncbi:hypothetical protein IJF89_00810 [Candidatus Saccharibacteria bacterium]|nr:hypothetical protein [Candidatus Saccharibacteria bacterium]